MKTKQVQASRFVRFVVSSFCLTASLLPLTSYGADTGTVRGRIIDKADGEGVYGASVTVAGTTIGTATDMNGNFTLQNVPAKSQKISVSIVGYAPTTQTVTVSTGQTASVSLQLGQTTIMASEVVVGASTYKQDRLDVPVTVNVVSQEKIRQEPNATLDKVVEDVPGVSVTRAGGQTTAGLQIRGSNTYQGGAIGTRVQGFYDGFPLNAPESGEIAWPSVNMNAADKVEILKGAAATLYGSGAMGGVVNVFGHLPDKLEVKAGVNGGFYDAPPSSDQSNYRKPAGTTTSSIGTPWFWNTYFGLGNKSGKWNYSLLYTHSNDDGYRQNAQTRLDDVKLKVRYDIDAKQYLQVSSFYSETVGGYAYSWPYQATGVPNNFTTIENRSFDIFQQGRAFASETALADYMTAHPGEMFSGMPLPTSFPTTVFMGPGNPLNGSYTAAQYAHLVNTTILHGALTNYRTYDTVYADDIIKRKNAQVGLNYVNLLSDKVSLDTRAYYTGFDTRIEYNPTAVLQDYPITDRTPGEFNQTYSNRYGAGAKLDWRINDHHRLIFGVDGNITDVMSTTVAAELPTKNTLKPIQEKNAAAFVQDEWKITDKLTSLLSLRYDWSSIDATRAETTAGHFIDLTNKSVDAISPRVALNYKAMDDMSFRASYGKSFRAPTLSERFIRDGGMFTGIPNPALDKESMTAYEVGMFKQFGDKVSLDIAGYINDYENLIESIITPIGSGGTFIYQNITKARIWGIETSLNYRPSNEWLLNANYTYMNAKNLSYVAGQSSFQDLNPDPTWLPYRAEHMASAGATWKPTNKLTLNLNGRYVSQYKSISTYANATRTNYPGGFILLNTGVKYQAVDTVSLSLLCRNIGNVQYEEAEWFRAPGRSYVFGVDCTF